MAVHASGLLLILCTLYCIAPFKSLISWHPLFMMIGLCGFSLQGIIVFNRYSSLVPSSPTHRKPRTSNQLHAISGAVFFSLGCLVTALGLQSDWFQHKVLVDVIQDQGVRLLIGYFFAFLLGLLGMVTLKQVYDKYFSSTEGSKNISSAQVKKTK
ncbi:unnamed protein product [Taenia asiatica]|uniref:Cytochrome b561 domain-containing protein n=1 Tax=Taenia asiatica TaxID=60517 RepID=A0A0R3W5T7_TAEAS|nr:unnamed protein product [Taenia asiatica]